jgi:RimJ/RimL family protein N-acetyltransferase
MSAWLPDGFQHPTRVDLSTGHHLRPMGPADTEIDFPAVMGSRERLWARYGEPWGWPPAHMTPEMDRDDLQHHEDEINAHESFLYGVFDADETELFGCIYIDPPRSEAVQAESSWWVVDKMVGSDLERELNAFVPGWLGYAWGLERVDYSLNG